MVTSKEKKDRAANTRYLKAYGMTLTEVEALSKRQNDACAICGRPFGDKRGCVDHAHRISNAKITRKQVDGWHVAEAVVDGKAFVVYSITKSEAKKELRDRLKRKSVRAMLCFICNRMVLGRMERVSSMTEKTYPVKLESLRNYLMTYDPTNPLVTEN